MNHNPTKRTDRARWRRRDDKGQQALLLVMAVALIMFSFSLVLVTQSTGELPIVNKTLIDHAAYRALQAGVNDYLYAINQNPNGVTCTSYAAPSCAYFTTQGFKFNQFTQVPNTPTGQTGISYAPEEWTSVGYPVINQSTGTVQVAVVGAAGFDNASTSIEYQTANVSFKANNSFLLSVSWNQYNAIDPSLYPAVGTGCTPTGYLWGPTGTTNCGTNDEGILTPSFPYYGPVFSDDEVVVCNTPTVDHLTTAAPSLSYAAGGCNSTVTYLTPSKNLIINPYPQSPPTNINALTNPSKLQGCYYVGPTTITFNSSGGYYVSSPDTPPQASNGTTNTTYDGDSLANNKSTCFPSSGGTSGTVSGPANGVIYVDSLTGSACTGSLPANPLLSAYNGSPFKYDGEGLTPNCEGDAIVSGQVSGGYTLAAQNDIMIDNNLTYQDCGDDGGLGLSTAEQNAMNNFSPLREWPASADCASLPTTGTIDTLGLIANNFVSINNPLTGTANNAHAAKTCGTSGAPASPACAVPNPIVMASILALGHALSVPNFQDSPSYLGTVDFYGSLGEKYIDVEEYGSVGYGVDFTWDTRLSILSPPEFFTPSTPSWITNSFSVTVGKCSEVWPINTSACPTIP